MSPHSSLSAEKRAMHCLKTLLLQEDSLDAFTKSFEKNAPHIEDQGLREHILLCITQNLNLLQSATWRSVGAKLKLCHEAGWQCDTASTRSSESPTLSDIWVNFTEKLDDASGYWKRHFQAYMQRAPSDLETLGTTFALFLTLLPPPSGIHYHASNALRLLNLPLLRAVRLGTQPHTHPLFSQETFRTNLWESLTSGRLLRVSTLSTLPLFAEQLFKEVGPMTEDLSPTFFEELKRTFQHTHYVASMQGTSRPLTLDEKQAGVLLLEGAYESAYRAHTHEILTHALSPTPSVYQAVRRRI